MNKPLYPTSKDVSIACTTPTYDGSKESLESYINYLGLTQSIDELFAMAAASSKVYIGSKYDIVFNYIADQM